jgi:hypothetical protein
MTCVAMPYDLESMCHDTIEKNTLRETLPHFVRKATKQRIERLTEGSADV